MKRGHYLSARFVAAVAMTCVVMSTVGMRAAFAHCNADQGSNSLIITNTAASATWNASANSVATSVQQTWGAPWCYVSDTSDVYRSEGGAWVWRTGKYWSDTAAVDSGYHPGAKRSWTFTGLPNGSYRHRHHAYRISSHTQLLGLPIGDEFIHLNDSHNSYRYGTL